jgi:hypothetical protein
VTFALLALCQGKVEPAIGVVILGLVICLGHASASEMACRHCGVSPGANAFAYTRGVLARWEHDCFRNREPREVARSPNCCSE